jgi:hypothetical protein
VRRLQPHRHLPALAGAQVGWLALRQLTSRPAPPYQPSCSRGGTAPACARQPGRLHRQAKAQARLVALGHGGHHAGHPQVAAFQRGRQRLAGKGLGPPAAGRPPPASSAAQRQQHGPARALASRPGGRQRQQDRPAPQNHVHGHRPQRRLLQLQRGARHAGAQHGQRSAPAALPVVCAWHGGIVHGRGPTVITTGSDLAYGSDLAHGSCAACPRRPEPRHPLPLRPPGQPGAAGHAPAPGAALPQQRHFVLAQGRAGRATSSTGSKTRLPTTRRAWCSRKRPPSSRSRWTWWSRWRCTTRSTSSWSPSRRELPVQYAPMVRRSWRPTWCADP